MTEFGQVDAIHRLDVVPNIQLVTPSTERWEAERIKDMKNVQIRVMWGESRKEEEEDGGER